MTNSKQSSSTHFSRDSRWPGFVFASIWSSCPSWINSIILSPCSAPRPCKNTLPNTRSTVMLPLCVMDLHGNDSLCLFISFEFFLFREGGKNLHRRDLFVLMLMSPIRPTAVRKTGLSGFEISLCRTTSRAMLMDGPSIGKYGFWENCPGLFDCNALSIAENLLSIPSSNFGAEETSQTWSPFLSSSSSSSHLITLAISTWSILFSTLMDFSVISNFQYGCPALPIIQRLSC
mmetsp:Transcript_4998/g.11932  ORF Transcript_4998/g.11932 Transcript_4998/m.11932 type:complete len:232 (+) Transcript_4998:190-885(+)